MDWKIVAAKWFKKSLKRLDPGVAARIIREIGVLMDDPFIGKPLKGLYLFVGDNRYRVYSLRVGDYRVAYTIDQFQRIVYLLYVAHRKNIYKELKRILET